MKYLIAIAAFCLISGCASPEEVARRQQMQKDADMETCRSYGMQPGSELFGNCLLQLDLARDQRNNYYYNYPRYYGPHFNSGIYFMHR